MIDEFENDAGRRARDKQLVGYGQIQAFIHTTLPANPSIKVVPAIVALVRMCKTDGEDASIKPIKYKYGDMEAGRAFSVATIDCAVGRVKIGNWWGIVDRSFGPLRITIYDIQEPEYESVALPVECSELIVPGFSFSRKGFSLIFTGASRTCHTDLKSWNNHDHL